MCFSRPPEARISTNWFNPQWSGFRRVKNVFVQMEWVPDLAKALRSKEPLLLDPVEEMEMHKKLRTAWDLLMRGEGIEMPSPEVTITRSETQVVPGKKAGKRHVEVYLRMFSLVAESMIICHPGVS